MTLSNFKNIGLRERKIANKKIEILNIMLKKTVEKNFIELSIKEICDEAMISEGTFFNYFPKKSDLLNYFIQLWSYQSYYLTEKEFGRQSGLKKIEHFFHCTSNRKTIGNKRILYEIISNIALEDNNDPFANSNISKAELLAAFPDYTGIESIRIENFNDIFMEYIRLAIELEELKENIDINIIMLSLGSIFYGVPIILKDNPEMIMKTYSIMLNNLWKIFS